MSKVEKELNQRESAKSADTPKRATERTEFPREILLHQSPLTSVPPVANRFVIQASSFMVVKELLNPCKSVKIRGSGRPYSYLQIRFIRDPNLLFFIRVIRFALCAIRDIRDPVFLSIVS